MSLRIKTNIASEKVQTNLKAISGSNEQSLERLSSGKRINKSADDAAGLAVASNLNTTTRGLRQAARNANDGISLVQVAEGGVNEINNIITRMRELTIQAASDTIGNDERGYLDLEFQQLKTEIDRIAKSTKFSGRSLLNGEGESYDFFVGAYAKDHNKITFDSGVLDMQVDSIGIDHTTIADKFDAQDSMEDLDVAQNSINGQRAVMGSIQNRMQSTVRNLEVQALNQNNAKSGIEDTDVAAEAARLASNTVIKEAGVAVMGQANNLPNSALRLIG